MDILSFPDHLASAYAVHHGPHGAVSALARQRGQSRQALYRQAHALQLCALPDRRRALCPTLRRRLARLRRLCRHLRQQLRGAFHCDADRRARFAATAQAEGVSLPVARCLLAILLGEQTPSVAALGRDAQRAAARAGALLEVLDEQSRPRVRQACADEIFVGRRPILMVVEPRSLCWQVGHLADDRSGATWAGQLAPLSRLEQLSKDDGSGLGRGLELVNQQRRAEGRPEVADQADHFHLLRAGGRALRRLRGDVTRALERAEEADRQVAQADRRGQKKSGPVKRSLWGWRQAEDAYQRWAAADAAWQRLRGEVLPRFTPEGQLNTRARAEAALAQLLPALHGPEWSKARRQLARPELFTFLDRTEQALAAVPGDERVKALLVRAEGLRQRPESLRGQGRPASARRGLLLVVAALLSAGGAAVAALAGGVRRALWQSWRSSSLVEGLNSVLRMGQARHRRLSQGLLDLKRLYWNLRPLRTGRRKKRSPYQLLGLQLPVTDWWELLRREPQQLREQLSAPPLAG
jgi:hypothetical protein